jgi:hypothetical protein
MQEVIEVEKWLDTNRDYILDTLSGLIQINTVNMPPGGNEKPGQEYIYNIVSKYIPEKDIDMFEIDDVSGIRQNPWIPATERMNIIKLRIWTLNYWIGQIKSGGDLFLG